MGSGGRLWALLRIFLYNKVLGRGLMGSRVAPGPSLARSSVKIQFYCRNNISRGKQQTWGVARATAHACHGPHGAPRGPKGPLGAPWAQTMVTFAGGGGPYSPGPYSRSDFCLRPGRQPLLSSSWMSWMHWVAVVVVAKRVSEGQMRRVQIRK